MVAIEGTERVLVCPLGWGLGHASRVIPIISYLLQKGCTVTIAGDAQTLSLLQAQFPQCTSIHFPSIAIKLWKRGRTFALILIAIKILGRTIGEQRELKRIIDEHRINLVISDNRYGLHSQSIPSVLITHQLQVIFPSFFKWAETLGRWFIRRHALQFHECWVPDSPSGFRLSGQLSMPKKIPGNVRFIGLLSRFSDHKKSDTSHPWDLVGIVSGPPPQRAIFERELVNLGNRLSLKTLIIRGLPQYNSKEIEGLVTLVAHLPDHEMARVILSAKYIICRSGYSTLMDLMALERKALLVPTPGQTEQEYLANYLGQQKIFKSCLQNKLSTITLNKLNDSQSGKLLQPVVSFFPKC
ncbi:MAG TPA: glycosyltransferase [Tenuifilaceae bacterium]|nr:glycosyltransferase [Tenuifilaceae bacterium]